MDFMLNWMIMIKQLKQAMMKEQKKANAYAMKNARVHVIATHFLPVFDFLSCMDVIDTFDPKGGVSNKQDCLYLEQRILGEEYRYV